MKIGDCHNRQTQLVSVTLFLSISAVPELDDWGSPNGDKRGIISRFGSWPCIHRYGVCIWHSRPMVTGYNCPLPRHMDEV